MSKEIFLYSEDKKYKCAFELCDTLGEYQIPDHSVMILFEEREDGNYVIAEARDKILVTEKDKKIANLEAQLAESEKKIEELKGERLKFYTDDVRRTQVINGVHFDIEQLLVFSEYVEHEKWVKADYKKEIDKLKQKLTEKEKMLERIMSGEYIPANIAKKSLELSNQDKILFAVEQLKQTRKLVDELLDNCGDKQYKVWEVFDNQIKEIKGD